MKKHLLSIFAILICTSTWAQKDPEIIVFDFKVGKPIFYRKFDSFKVTNVRDKRPIKSRYVGKVSNMSRKMVPIGLEDTSFVNNFKKIFTVLSPKTENLTELTMDVNCFEMGSELYNQIVPFVLIDVDFYKKNEKKEEVIAGHYHGKVCLKNGVEMSVVETAQKLVFTSLRVAFQETDKTIVNIGADDDVSYNDTTYIPQEGIYMSLLDYKHNTPYKPSGDFLTAFLDNGGLSFSSKFDSLQNGFFGYSTGKQFYISPSPLSISGRSINLIPVTHKGRYLYVNDGNMNYDNKDATNKAIVYGVAGGLGGAIVGAMAGGVMSSNYNNFNSNVPYLKDVIYDIELGKTYYTAKDEYFELLNMIDDTLNRKAIENKERKESKKDKSIDAECAHFLNIKNHGIRLCVK